MQKIRRLSLAMRAPEDVIPFLGKPTHWKYGRSAKSVADSWFRANDLPLRVRRLLNQSDELLDCELIDGWLERSTDLGDQRGTHSQTDLLAVLGLKSGLAVIGVEAKVTESFGPFVSDWLADESFGKKQRLTKLLAMLDIAEVQAMALRYQLLHRTAAAMLEAKRYRTNNAVMAVHSFCPNGTGFPDFAKFAEAMGFGTLERDQLSQPRRVDGINLWLGWVSDDVPEDLSWEAFDAKYPPSNDFPTLEEIRAGMKA